MDTEPHIGECHVDTKAEMRATCLQAQEHQDCQQSTRSREETGNGFFLRASERTSPTNTWFSHFWPPELGDNK